MIVPRPEVQAFAELIEAALRKHDADLGDGWKEMDLCDCMEGVYRESEELRGALSDLYDYEDGDERIAKEAADVAAYCCFFAHQAMEGVKGMRKAANRTASTSSPLTKGD